MLSPTLQNLSNNGFYKKHLEYQFKDFLFDGFLNTHNFMNNITNFVNLDLSTLFLDIEAGIDYDFIHKILTNTGFSNTDWVASYISQSVINYGFIQPFLVEFYKDNDKFKINIKEVISAF